MRWRDIGHNALVLALSLSVPLVFGIGISITTFGIGLAVFLWHRGLPVPWKICLLIGQAGFRWVCGGCTNGLRGVSEHVDLWSPFVAATGMAKVRMLDRTPAAMAPPSRGRHAHGPDEAVCGRGVTGDY